MLTGGSTAGDAYEHAAALEPDWSEASVWWGDERCVPPDDERSNYGLAKRTLLDRLERQPEVHRIRGELDPADAAGEYERELEGVALDLLLLGLGPDGHVASLFPGSPQLARARAARDERPGRARAVRRPRDDDPAGAALGAADRLPRHRRRARPTPSTRAFRGEITRRGAGEPAARGRRADRRLPRRGARQAGSSGDGVELGREAAARGEQLQHDHRVGDGDVLEVGVARLERGEHGLDRLACTPTGSGAAMQRERVGDRRRKVVALADRVA